MLATKLVQILSMILIAVLAMLGLNACLPQSFKHRGQIVKELAKVEMRFNHGQNNKKMRKKYADMLFQCGRFLEAKDILLPLYNKKNPDALVQLRMAELLYLLGEYQAIEAMLKRVIEANPENQQISIQAQLYLAFYYYQTNQFSKSHDLFKDMQGKIKLPMLDLMKSFGMIKPYEVEWLDAAHETEIAFVKKDPLPLIPVTIQGREIYALIDTGGDAFILDKDLADDLKIKIVAAEKGAFGGGKENQVGFAQAENLVIGKARLNHVPINILPTRQMSAIYQEGKYQISGIVGTGVLRQFLATIDYPGGKLILRDTSPGMAERFYRSFDKKQSVVMPFALWATHLMLAQGSINDKGPMIFFVDSGLASSKQSLIAPKQTLEYLGIPEPIRKKENSVGGGGGVWKSAEFSVASLSLGPLRQERVFGEYGGLTPNTYWDNGFIQDGIISHRFLREYVWTIDFIGRKMIFEKR